MDYTKTHIVSALDPELHSIWVESRCAIPTGTFVTGDVDEFVDYLNIVSPVSYKKLHRKAKKYLVDCQSVLGIVTDYVSLNVTFDVHAAHINTEKSEFSLSLNAMQKRDSDDFTQRLLLLKMHQAELADYDREIAINYDYTKSTIRYGSDGRIEHAGAEVVFYDPLIIPTHPVIARVEPNRQLRNVLKKAPK